jgi:putative tryptophan/tyrosine transport system substrate-binding protein
MRRREFIAVLGGATAAWPFTSAAQQPMPIIGYLHSGSPGPFAHLVAAFHRGLKETGYAEGQNVTIEYRWAEGHYERLLAFAADLVRRQVNVIISGGGAPAVLAAKAATTTIPIVFSAGGDPVGLGLVGSLSHPDGNITGANVFTTVMEGKRLGLLHELVPRATVIAVLLNPGNTTNFETQSKDVQVAADVLGQKVHILRASSNQELDAAFSAATQMRAGAMLVGADPSFFSWRDQIVGLAARHAIPAIYEQRAFALAGGLMSYGTSFLDAYHQVGIYAGRILKGEKPANLPVVQATKFEFVLNLKTAKSLGLDVPPSLSARADEVLE